MMLDESFLMMRSVQNHARACTCLQCKQQPKQNVVVVSRTKAQSKTGGFTDCGHPRLRFGSVRSYCNMFRFAGPLLGMPILSTV